MSEKYYTVEQIASMLDIHPKTIQRYIREGKLRANKVGKGWRVTGHDLSVFTEGTGNAPKRAEGEPTAYAAETVKVSSVIDIDVPDMDEAMRIVNTITAVLNVKPPEYGRPTMQAQYMEPERKVRLMLWGTIAFMRVMLDAIEMLTNQNSIEQG